MLTVKAMVYGSFLETSFANEVFFSPLLKWEINEMIPLPNMVFIKRRWRTKVNSRRNSNHPHGTGIVSGVGIN